MADLLRYLRDQQVLTQEQGRWTLQQSVSNLRRDLPESVRGRNERIDERLPEQAPPTAAGEAESTFAWESE